MLSNRLRDRRQQLGLSQENLARSVGVGNQQIWRYENGNQSPSSEIAAKIAQALNTSADYLLGLTDDPTPPQKDKTLSEQEMQVIAAWRRGDKLGAIRLLTEE